MKSKLLVLVLFAAVIAVAVLLSNLERRERTGVTNGEPSNTTKSGDKIVGGGTVSWGTQTMQITATQSVQPIPENADPDFQKYIADEAKQVDATHIDSAAKSLKLADTAAKLTPTQAKQLLQTARDPQAPAGERILSAYLMVQAGPRAEAELKQLIVSPVSNPGPHEERSVRAMAIDGLVARATKEASAREALAKTIPDIPDSYIKNYATKRLGEIKAR